MLSVACFALNVYTPTLSPILNINYCFVLINNAIGMISDREVRVCVLVATQQARERDAVQVWRAAAGGRRPTGRGRW
jgi:hypothetical protein